MGKLTGGIDNDLIGRLGNHVGRRVKGENIISMRPAKSNKPPTAAQLAQRLKFGLFTHWLRSALPILEIGYQHYEAEMSAYNMAVSENMKYAVTGVSPNFTINYSEARFSKGVLRKVSDAEIATTAGAAIEFTWGSVIGQSYSKADDQVGVIAYDPLKDEFVALMNAAVRSAEEYELQLPLDWTGDVVHCWVLVVSADSKRVSDTKYVGQLTVV
ncbi:DUF6266 family protein [Pedobacter frigoris]|uniref:Uncharacterized protein n=1 Tax=Pedobacter frigoris TaxID=2571272 RepID=A0A4U1CNC5_9SPHI|nr:DUF6266 family protein [Pedobacter frigoris]TKC08994.1 hypothetical protein FA047_02545 [Pedobacter frigoris]